MPSTSSWHTFTRALHLFTLGLWLGVIAMSGAAAAILFPTIKELDPLLPEYTAYTGEHWRLAAGLPAERIFLVADIAGFVCSFLAAATFGCLATFFRLPVKSPTTISRAFVLAVALACFASNLIIIRPQMNSALNTYRAAALRGDNQAALTHQQAFADLHPIASNLMIALLVSVLLTFVLALKQELSLASDSAKGPRRPGSLETPKLAT